MTRLLVVDDSPLMRRLLGRLLTEQEGFEVAYARDGAEALAALQSFRPEVITLDVQMPGMDGLQCLDRIMIERPTPVVMVSSLTSDGAAEAVEALALGAVDVIEKPKGAVSLEMDRWGPMLLRKVRAAASAKIRRTHRLAERVRALTGAPEPEPPPHRGRRQTAGPAPAPAPGAPAGLVLVGCSTGGPAALDALLAPLPADFPWPLVVAQHMPAAFTGALARRLNGLCRLEVSEVGGPTPLEPGHVYIGRGDADVVIASRARGLVVLGARPDPAYPWTPSVDRLVTSAMAAAAPERLFGVLMTGMGNDGARAMARLKAGGGWTLAESEDSAVVWGMPGELVKAGGATEVAALDELSGRLIKRAST